MAARRRSSPTPSDGSSAGVPARRASTRSSSTAPASSTTVGSVRSPKLRAKPASSSESKVKGVNVPRIDPNKLQLEERVVRINRVAKVVRGGRRFSFSAVIVVGDGNGHVGIGLGKAGEVPEAIRKGVEDAKKKLIRVPLYGTSIPHAVSVDFGASTVLLRPASAGTGVIAGGSVRAVVEAAGIRDILSKSMGSTNPVNVVRAA